MKYYELISKLNKLQAKYNKLINQIIYDLKFLELNWLKDSPIIEGLKKKYNELKGEKKV